MHASTFSLLACEQYPLTPPMRESPPEDRTALRLRLRPQPLASRRLFPQPRKQLLNAGVVANGEDRAGDLRWPYRVRHRAAHLPRREAAIADRDLGAVTL